MEIQESETGKISDSELLQAIHSKSHSSFNIFFKRYGRKLYAFVLKRVGSESVADDIMQEFWIKLWENTSFLKCDAKGCVRPYLFQYMQFRVYDHFRFLCPETIELDEMLTTGAEQVYTHILESLEEEDLLRIVSEVIEKLPEISRQTFWLRVNDTPVRDVSKTLSISPQTVYNRYSEALSQVRSFLVKNHPNLVENYGAKRENSDTLPLVILLLALSSMGA